MSSIFTPLTVGVVVVGILVGMASPVAAPCLESDATSDRAAAMKAVYRLPVTFGFAAPTLARAAVCDAALIDLAVGTPVPVGAAPCLRAYVLEPAAGGPVMAMPAPETCEALLPALAIGVPVPLGVGVPCVESYILTGREQLAIR
ncbi:hypothetical protein [Roseospira visakhapatnamensis]|uniref:Uncharacterized protein n=1 Tax=Roseospira visakhapatnamensis TaxID=390880 RepID=A0A7W6RFG4_9PROT|nr:hypothetical protein [Roseospira visakhapatnamensis]MBB4266953.1 hypothetical protein [Roseospira visakhapatnamensis]